MSAHHKSTEPDDIVAFYPSRHGPSELARSVAAAAEKLGIGSGTLQMRIGNVKFLDGSRSARVSDPAVRPTEGLQLAPAAITPARVVRNLLALAPAGWRRGRRPAPSAGGHRSLRKFRRPKPRIRILQSPPPRRFTS